MSKNRLILNDKSEQEKFIELYPMCRLKFRTPTGKIPGIKYQYMILKRITEKPRERSTIRIPAFRGRIIFACMLLTRFGIPFRYKYEDVKNPGPVFGSQHADFSQIRSSGYGIFITEHPVTEELNRLFFLVRKIAIDKILNNNDRLTYRNNDRLTYKNYKEEMEAEAVAVEAVMRYVFGDELFKDAVSRLIKNQDETTRILADSSYFIRTRLTGALQQSETPGLNSVNPESSGKSAHSAAGGLRH
ncbi:hypothetical protein CHS0354_001974 [Potamilus streckersoni]|uniref:Uncharacterized protein n=1 Tax=Potamilus streckersoni TaxID=2493646 RepID=A0AAE0T5G0_9BIVA|nr:hypothetical protein CHS0354_001974 [Potamilus streckersoni]